MEAHHYSAKFNGTLTQQIKAHGHLHREREGGLVVGLEYGGGLLTSDEDQLVLKLVVQKHSSDDCHLDVGSLFDYVELIFDQTTNNGNRQGSEVHKAAYLGSGQDELRGLIEQVCCEMGCKCPGGGAGAGLADSHNSALAVLGILEHYPWEAKMVFTLAALAVNYEEFSLLSRIYAADPAVSDARLMVESVKRELSTRYNKMKVILTILEESMTSLHQIVEEQVEERAYKEILVTIFETVHQNNTAVIQTLTCANDNDRPLFRGNDKVRLNDLEGSPVLFLIAAHDETIEGLLDLHDELRTKSYNILWVPVVDRSTTQWSESMQDEHQRSRKKHEPWFSVDNPSVISNAVIRFFI